MIGTAQRPPDTSMIGPARGEERRSALSESATSTNPTGVTPEHERRSVAVATAIVTRGRHEARASLIAPTLSARHSHWGRGLNGGTRPHTSRSAWTASTVSTPPPTNTRLSCNHRQLLPSHRPLPGEDLGEPLKNLQVDETQTVPGCIDSSSTREIRACRPRVSSPCRVPVAEQVAHGSPARRSARRRPHRGRTRVLTITYDGSRPGLPEHLLPRRWPPSASSWVLNLRAEVRHPMVRSLGQ